MGIFDTLKQAVGTAGVRELKTGAIAAVIEQITGSPPIIEKTQDYNRIKFSAPQASRLREWIEAQMAAKPGDVRIELKNVAYPIILKKAIPFMIGAAFLGVIAAGFIRKG